jgi:hypothetical protein
MQESETEDLDLSYRAQLKKWKFKYLIDVVTLNYLLLLVQPFTAFRGIKEVLREK